MVGNQPDFDLDAAAQCGTRLKDMLQNSPGWKDVKAMMDAMRKEAFLEWTSLPLNAPTETVISIRAKDSVIAALLARIEESVKAGDEVAYPRFAGVELTHDDVDYLIMREGDLLAVV